MLKPRQKPSWKAPPEETEFKAGESVFLERFGAYGIILSEKKNNRIRCSDRKRDGDRLKERNPPCGGWRCENVAFAEDKSRACGKKDVSMTLDLRGKRYEEGRLLGEIHR